jgi:hypothetical protein
MGLQTSPIEKRLPLLKSLMNPVMTSAVEMNTVRF